MLRDTKNSPFRETFEAVLGNSIDKIIIGYGPGKFAVSVCNTAKIPLSVPVKNCMNGWNNVFVDPQNKFMTLRFKEDTDINSLISLAENAFGRFQYRYFFINGHTAFKINQSVNFPEGIGHGRSTGPETLGPLTRILDPRNFFVWCLDPSQIRDSPKYSLIEPDYMSEFCTREGPCLVELGKMIGEKYLFPESDFDKVGQELEAFRARYYGNRFSTYKDFVVMFFGVYVGGSKMYFQKIGLHYQEPDWTQDSPPDWLSHVSYSDPFCRFVKWVRIKIFETYLRDRAFWARKTNLLDVTTYNPGNPFS